MHKTKLKNKKISDSFFNLLAIVLIIFSINTNMAYGSNNNWVEISRTIDGSQYWDRDSLINKEKGVIEISTKY